MRCQGAREQYSTVRWYEIQNQTVKGSELSSPRVRAGPVEAPPVHGTVYDTTQPRVEKLPFTEVPKPPPEPTGWWRRPRRDPVPDARPAPRPRRPDRRLYHNTEDWENTAVRLDAV